MAATRYRVEMSDYLSDGGGNCSVFTEGTNAFVTVMDMDPLVAYFANH